MSFKVQIAVSPEKINDHDYHLNLISKKTQIDKDQLNKIVLEKRSIDARNKRVKYNLIYQVFHNEPYSFKKYDPLYQKVHDSSCVVHIVGSGPAGLFAALTCLKHGIKPIIFERGKEVSARRRDVALLNRDGVVDPESNYCFGEGGAGTFSDGKLYTRAKKRGDIIEVLKMLVFHGADNDILIDSHPHIGTNKLPKIIQDIREFIIESGGEVHFRHKVTDMLIKDDQICQLEINKSNLIHVQDVILATGHSSRDIFQLLFKKSIQMEFKPFAVGVRIEHQQELIDKIQYGSRERSEFLPPASYSLVFNSGERSVYSFCMCPGGIIAPCSTQEGQIVTNGWSPSKRNNKYSNSGIVVEVKWSDLSEYHQYGPLAGMNFQLDLEKKCSEYGGGSQVLPAQRLIDFLNGEISKDLPDTSYQPGIKSSDLSEIFPNFIHLALKRGLSDFGNKLKGFLTNDAVLHATESRTSSPVRIPRNEKSEHPDVQGLYPCGEGAGYAGGIISAAIDGISCVESIALKYDLN